MSYAEKSDVEALIPAEFLDQALNDENEDGGADAGWVKVASAVDRQINALLSVSFSVPLSSPYPTLITQAATILAASLCYKRRGKTGENNPWESQEESWLERLAKIGKGEETLTPTSSIGGGSVISEESKVTNSNNNLMV